MYVVFMESRYGGDPEWFNHSVDIVGPFDTYQKASAWQMKYDTTSDVSTVVEVQSPPPEFL